MNRWAHHGPAIMRRLARARGRIVPPEALLAAMYDGARTAEYAENILRQTVRRLRRDLPPGALQTHPGEGYSLCPQVGAEWLDRRETSQQEANHGT